MNRVARHPDSETLLRLADEDLSLVDALAIRVHLRGCADCRERRHAMQEALDDYVQFHRNVLKASLPPPPEPWKQPDFPKTRSTHFRVTRPRVTAWLAAAVAIAAVFLMARRFGHAPEVRAAELLRKAAAAEQAAPPSRVPIRIRSRTRTVDRAARLTGVSPGPETPDASALHAIFEAARYSWHEPLSAAAFSRWRDSLPERQDQIDESGGILLVHTTSREGVLSDAALTLRATDLHAVACTLRLRSSGETIEMTELSPETLPAPAPPRQPQAAAPAAPAKPASVGDELRVIAALHGIGADLGEPIEVERAGSNVLVRISGLDERRRNQIRAALAGIAVAQLRLEEVPGGDSVTPLPAPRTGAPTDRVNPLISGLRTRMGSGISASGLTDELIDATDRAAERAFALRALARRFRPEAMPQLSPSDADILNSILRDHASGLATAIQEIRRRLAPILPNPSPPATGSDAVTWQTLAEDLPATVERIDTTLNGATDSSDARKAQLAGTIAELNRQVEALKSMLQP